MGTALKQSSAWYLAEVVRTVQKPRFDALATSLQGAATDALGWENVDLPCLTGW